jgi:hypothetical protein
MTGGNLGLRSAGFDSKADQPVWKADIPAHNSFLAR